MNHPETSAAAEAAPVALRYVVTDHSAGTPPRVFVAPSLIHAGQTLLRLRFGATRLDHHCCLWGRDAWGERPLAWGEPRDTLASLVLRYLDAEISSGTVRVEAEGAWRARTGRPAAAR